MDVTIKFKDGTSKTHNSAILVGEGGGQIVCGSGFNVGRYDSDTVLSFTGTPSFGKDISSIDAMIEILQKYKKDS